MQTLTNKEQEIDALLKLGFSNYQISDMLDIDESTVRKHKERINEKKNIVFAPKINNMAGKRVYRDLDNAIENIPKFVLKHKHVAYICKVKIHNTLFEYHLKFIDDITHDLAPSILYKMEFIPFKDHTGRIINTGRLLKND